MAVTPAISSAVGTFSTMAKRGRCLSARLLVGLLFGLARQDHESSVAGHRQGFEVQVEPVVVLVGPQGADFGPDGVVLLALHQEQGVAGAVRLAVVRREGDLPLVSPAASLVAGWVSKGERRTGGAWQRRGRPRGPWGRRLDALSGAVPGLYPTDTWPHRSAGLDGSGLP